jgi:sulfonate transport system permease protein
MTTHSRTAARDTEPATAARQAPPATAGPVTSGSGPAGPATAVAGISTATDSAVVASPAAGLTKRPRRGGKWWLRLVSPIVLLVIWQLASMTGAISKSKLPPPSDIWSTAVTLVTKNSPTYGTLQGAMAISLERVAIGLAIGAIFGIGMAMITGLSRLGEYSVDPIMQMLRTLPLFGLIPVFIVWFGIGELPKVLLIALGATIPLYLNTFAGIRSVDAKLAELGQVLGLNRRELIRHVVIPGALPQMLTGLRQSLGVAWLALVVAEQFNANAGLGYILTQGQQFLQMNYIFVALIVYCLLGLITDAIVRQIERRALTWRRGLAV